MTKERMNNILITLVEPKSPISEAYRSLRTNIQFASIDRPLKRVLVTSPSPGEGKSTVAANFAITMAQAGKKVILVDCDLRRPSLDRKFNLHNFLGLTNALFEPIPLEGLLQETKVDGLKVLTSGPIPPNPSEILASNKMKEFLVQLDRLGDFLIIDTPPILAVTDAAILSPYSDGVILTIESGKTKLDEAKRAKELLDNVNAKILGTVLNKVEAKAGSQYYYYYGEIGRKKG